MHSLRALRQTPLAAWLMLALLVRSVVPDGFMPGDGELVQLCTPQGVVELQWDEASGEWLASDSESSHAPCDWSMTPTAGLAWTAMFVPAIVPAFDQPYSQQQSLAPSTQPLRPPARAPPRHV